MNHLLNIVIAVIGATVTVLVSTAATSLIWVSSGRFDLGEVATGIVCFIIFWILLEVKDILTRRGVLGSRGSSTQQSAAKG